MTSVVSCCYRLALRPSLTRSDSGFIALLDFPALSNQPGHRNEGNSLSTLCLNMASERIASYITSSMFSATSAKTQAEEGLSSTSIAKPLSVPSSVSETVRIMSTQPGGLAHIIDDQSTRKGKNEKTMLDAMGKRWGKNRQFSWRKENDGSNRAGTFTIEHWSDGETVTYSTENFLEKNLNLVPNDLVDLLGGKAVAQMNTARSASKRNTSGKGAVSATSIIGGSSNSFVRELFANEVLAAAENERATLGNSQSSATKDGEAAGGLSVPGAHPSRKPSMRRKASTRKGDTEADGGLKRGKTIAIKRSELLARRCVIGNFRTALDELIETLSDSCRLFYVFCLAPNGGAQQGIDARALKSQVRALQLSQIRERCAQNKAAGWTTEMDFREFWDRYSVIDRWQQDLAKRAAGLMWTAKMEAVKEEMEWNDNEFTIGKGKVSGTASSALYAASKASLRRSSSIMLPSDRWKITFVQSTRMNRSASANSTDVLPSLKQILTIPFQDQLCCSTFPVLLVCRQRPRHSKLLRNRTTTLHMLQQGRLPSCPSSAKTLMQMTTIARHS